MQGIWASWFSQNSKGVWFIIQDEASDLRIGKLFLVEYDNDGYVISENFGLGQ